MTPEQLKYIRDWARSGNAWKRPCLCTGMPMDAMRERWGGMDGNEFQLNSAGLTIAKLADALEQGRAVLTDHCQVDYTQHCNYCGKSWGAHREDCAMMMFLSTCEEILGK